jgi:hypothetical protein
LPLTTYYCTREDIEKRLTAVGLAYCADDDLDGVGEQDNVNATDEAIAAAGVEIDMALTTTFETIPIQQTTRNEALRLWAVDIAAEYLSTRGGGAVVESLSIRAARARELLDQVAKGKMRVPGLTYPTDAWLTERRIAGRPRVANPRG